MRRLAALGAPALLLFAGRALGQSTPVACPLPTSPPTPIVGVRDHRMRSRQPRVRALVATEVEGLESALSTLPPPGGQSAPDSPQRVQLLRRLAEDYVELENAAARDQVPAQRDRARVQAVQTYDAIAAGYPSYPQLDEVLYYLGYEYERANDLPKARATYFRLIQQRPNSRYIPSAYLAFGEMFYVEAATDPTKGTLARQAYEKVIAFPPPENDVYGYAWFKLAHVHWHMGEGADAANAFVKARTWSATFAQDPAASAVASAAATDHASLHAACPSIPGP